MGMFTEHDEPANYFHRVDESGEIVACTGYLLVTHDVFLTRVRCNGVFVPNVTVEQVAKWKALGEAG